MKEYGDSAEGRNKRIEHIDTYSIDTPTGEGEEQIAGLMGIVYTIAFFAFLGILYYLASGLFHIFTFLRAIAPNEFILAQVVALGALIGGICLFFLREHKRMLYALLEMAVAIITGGTAISRLKDGDLYVWLALLGSVYLVVRSLENMQKAGFTFINTCNDYVGQHIFARRTHSVGSSKVIREEENKS
jgi:hypothetical protein